MNAVTRDSTTAKAGAVEAWSEDARVGYPYTFVSIDNMMHIV